MSHIATLLLRLALILVGYIAASLAASAFIHLMFLGSQDWRSDEVMPVVAGSIVFSIPFVALFVGYFAFVPALPVILLGEMLGKRDWLFYALGGAFVGACVVGMFWYATFPMTGGLGVTEPAAGNEGLATAPVMATVIAAGMIGGLGHWLVAGRTAGSWRMSG